MDMDLTSRRAGDKLKQDLRRDIETGKLHLGAEILGERRLAEKYGISYMTARRAIGSLEKEGLVKRLPRKGIVVTAPAKQCSKTIAYVVSDLKNNFNIQILDSVESKARQKGFNAIVCNSKLDVTLEAWHLKSVSNAGVSGIVLNPCFPPMNHEIVEFLTKSGLPLVVVDKFFEGLELDCVSCDNFDAAYRATAYLISLGHRRIAHITSNASLSGLSSVKERLAGYLKALEDNEIAFREDYVQQLDEVSVHTEMHKINLNYLGYEPMKSLLALPEPPTGVFLLNDSIAVGSARAIRDRRLRIPDDISLIGFDNDVISACMEIPLTTMEQSLRDMGEIATSLLFDRIEGLQNKPRHLSVKAQLIARNSCKRLEVRSLPMNQSGTDLCGKFK